MTTSPSATPHDRVERVDLTEVVPEMLARARSSSSGRAARTLTAGWGTSLSQTILALAATRSLDEHTAPGPATIQILHGSIRLRAGEDIQKLVVGDWATIPDQVHDVHALGDAVFLLTIAGD